jgi:hypothetical protein
LIIEYFQTEKRLTHGAGSSKRSPTGFSLHCKFLRRVL